jgi:hypothetical protein
MRCILIKILYLFIALPMVAHGGTQTIKPPVAPPQQQPSAPGEAVKPEEEGSQNPQPPQGQPSSAAQGNTGLTRGLIAGGVGGVSVIGLGALAYVKSTNQKPTGNTHADTEAVFDARIASRGSSQSEFPMIRDLGSEGLETDTLPIPQPIAVIKMPPPMIEPVPDSRQGPEQARTFDDYLKEMAESDRERTANGAKPLSRVLIVGARRGRDEGVKYPPSYFTMDVGKQPDLTHDISKALDQKYHGKFDAVVFEHLPSNVLTEPFANFDQGQGVKYHEQTAFKNASNALKPGGRLIINEGFANLTSQNKLHPEATLLESADTYKIYKEPRGVLWSGLKYINGPKFQGKTTNDLSHHVADRVRHHEAQDAQARFEGTDFHFLGLKPVEAEPLWVKKPELPVEGAHLNARVENPHVLVAIKR